MKIGVLKENEAENRVSILPEHISKLSKLKLEVLVERDAGSSAYAGNSEYENAGAVIASREDILGTADIIVSVNPPAEKDIKKIPSSAILVSTLNPLVMSDTINLLNAAKISSFSLDLIPRITRGQSMDVLSSMASVAGYRAVLDAARFLPRFFPMFMTAAGTIKPAKVLILGAGVAGLQAVATARKLGAVVEVFDVRSAVKEEVKSLGGKFIEVEGATEDRAAGGYAVEQSEEFKKKQAEMIQDHAVKSDIVICTAQIPGRKAPLLISKTTVENMKPGSVIIDLAASSGGNCEVTQNDKTIEINQVKVIGESNYPSTMPSDASKMYGTNLINLLTLLINSEGELNINFEDEIIAGTCLTHKGDLVNERVKSILNK
ncbi:MAG: Re/Si-specific NAD(P)(+) transhydrogenase subunit alpha [Marinilabiliaceae bacterium]|jgi:NAD(P) transhydrogenase subunit alpha|nr:Re/Si-specific NAD(P)(+) transhydrogenase subunit alpha [Marinilabiliaceae bacterium]